MHKKQKSIKTEKLCFDDDSNAKILRERVFKKFRELNPSVVPKTMTGNEPITVKIPCETVTKMPELKVIKLLSFLYFVTFRSQDSQFNMMFLFRKTHSVIGYVKFSLVMAKASALKTFSTCSLLSLSTLPGT